MMIANTIVLLALCVLNVNAGSNNCDLNFRNDLKTNQPLLVSAVGPYWQRPDGIARDAVEVRHDETVRLACPDFGTTLNSFSQFVRRNAVHAKCIQGKQFMVDGRSYAFDSLQCSFPQRPTEKRTGVECYGKDTELVLIGYLVENDFISVYEVCFHKNELATLFTKVEVAPYLSKNSILPTKPKTWSTNIELFKTMNIAPSYSCQGQIASFRKITGKPFLTGNCCFDRGQLVPDKDLLYVPQQSATYHYLNAVPQYSTCSHTNWEEIENRVRKLSENLDRPLTVWTGQYRKVRGGGRLNLFHYDLFLHYESDKQFGVPVPQFIWKVVYDPLSQKGVAIIYINQDVDLAELENLVLCRDICDNINWLNFLARKTIAKGYVYCCDLNDFEFGFAFKQNSPLPSPVKGVLRDDPKSRW